LKSASAANIPARETWDIYWKSGDPGYQFHKEITDRVKKFSSLQAVIIEIGSGLGVDAIEIATSGRTVIALDISRNALALMRSRISDRNSEIMPVVADALHLPFRNDSVDLIYHQGVMEHFSDPEHFLAEQIGALKSGGIMLADVPQTFTFYTLRKKWAMRRGKWFAGWETEYTQNRLCRRLRSAGLEIIETYGHGYDIRPLIWLSNLEDLGLKRFGHRILPVFIRRPASRVWRFWESLPISNNLRLCVGAVARKR